MSLAEQIKTENSKLSAAKLSGIRETLKNRKVVIINSNRPERKDACSEVVREKKMQIAREKVKKDDNNRTISNQPQQNQYIQQSQSQAQSQNQNTTNFKVNQKNAFESSGNFNTGISASVAPKPNFMGEQSSKPSFEGNFSSSLLPKSGSPSTFSFSRPQETSSIASGQVFKSSNTENKQQAPLDSPKPMTFKISSVTSGDVQAFTGFSSSVQSENLTDFAKKDNKETSKTFTMSSKQQFSIPAPAPSVNAITKSDSSTNFTFSDFSGSKNTFSSGSNTFKIPSTLTVEPILSSVTSDNTVKTENESESRKISSNFPLAQVPSKSVSVSSSDTKSSFSFNLGSTNVDQSSKSSTVSSTSTPTTAASIFGSPSITTTTNSETKLTSSFSFANAFAEPNSKFSKSATAPTSQPLELTKPKSDASLTDNLLDGLNICKPSTDNNTQAKSGNIFGSPPSNTPSNAASSMFGTSTSLASQSVAVTAVSIFGKPTITPATSSLSTTGQTAITNSTTTASSSTIFGQPITSIATSTATTASSIFGGGGSTMSSPAFGGTATFGGLGGSSPSNPTNIFAQAVAATPSFGSNNNPTSGGSIFGGGATSPVSSAPSFFGSPTSSTTAAAQVTSPFGTTTPSFGSPSQPGSSIFGGASSVAPVTEKISIFGTQPASAQPIQSPFGATNAAATAASGGSFFGSTGFGATSNNSASSIFGGGSQQTSAFGSSTIAPAFGSVSQQPVAQQSSIFGGNSANAFSSPQSTFGSTPFGNQPTATAFGATASPGAFSQPAAAFGAAPAFGGPATFGSPPAFGVAAAFASAPTFGGAPTFQSPTKSAFGTGFGTSPQAPAFGAPQQSNSLFEQLGSSDNAMTFGNLAQSANNNPKPAFGG